MKKRFYPALCLCLLFCVDRGTAQTPTTQQIDFSNLSQIKKFYDFPYDDHVKIQIININRFLYNIAEARADSEYNTTAPAILSTLALPPSLTSNLAPSASSISAQMRISAGNANPASAHTELLQNLQEIIKVENFFNEVITTHNDCINTSKDCNAAAAAIIADVTNKISIVVAGHAIPAGDIPTMVNAWELQAVQAIATANTDYQNIELLFRRWQQLSLAQHYQDLGVENGLLTDQTFKLDQLTAAAKGIKDPKKSEAAQQAVLAQQHIVGNIQATISQLNDQYQNDQKSEADLVAKANTLLTDINSYRKDAALYALFDDMKKINPSSYTYNSEIIKTKKDEIKLTFNVTSKQLLACNKPNESSFDVILKTHGGIKIDFSSGIFISGGGSNFVGGNYYYRPVADSMSTIAVPNIKNRLVVSIGGLMHIYRRSPSKVKLAASIGASLNTGATIYNLHAGPSLILGNKNRFILTGGLTLRQSTLLDNNYNMTTVYNTNLLPATVPTVNKFPVAGWFFSITYNLSEL